MPSAALKKVSEKPPIEKLDLSKVTRDSDTHVTYIYVVDLHWEHRNLPWIVCGSINIRDENTADVCAYLNNAVDQEHDSAKAFCIPIIGLEFKYATSGTFCFEAFIHPREPEGFRVPDSADELLQGAEPCKDCAYDREEPHIITEYIPKPNLKLYELLRGCKIDITTGPRSNYVTIPE